MQQAISAGHQTTLDTAKEILRAGGMPSMRLLQLIWPMFVSEPCMASAGGGGFAMTYQAQRGIRFLDFFCHTPRRKNSLDHIEFFPIEVDFGKDTEQFFIGAGSVATPGTMAGLFYLHKHFATMPFRELAAIPMQLAKEGVPIDAFQALDFELLQPILSWHEEGRHIFCKDGSMKSKGDLIHLPQMVDFLEYMISEGRDGFYKGEIGAKVADHQLANNGFLERADFENYRVVESAALSFDYLGRQIHTARQPSIGGTIMGNFFHSVSKQGKSETTKRLVQHLLDVKYHATEFDSNYGTHYAPTWSRAISSKGTSHFNIVDKLGNAIALTTSIGEGNGTFITGTQMQLNNMLGELFLLPDGPHSWGTNQRLNSMMTPTLVTDQQNTLQLILGSGGASRIPFALGQCLQYLYEDNFSLSMAIDAPRMHYHDQKLQAEFPAALRGESDNGIKFWSKLHMFFGGVNAIQKDKERCTAYADPRRFGVAEVF